jgi:uncharacterized membrane protein YhaH (DUF805 family)
MSTSYAFHKYVYGAYYVCSVLIVALYVVSALSIMARRLRDLGFSAWWLVIFILPIVLPAPADDFDFMRWWPDLFLGPRLFPTLAPITLLGLLTVLGFFPGDKTFPAPIVLRSIIYCAIILLTVKLSYAGLTYLGVPNSNSNLATERIEDVLALIGNDEGSQVSKNLASTFSKTSSIIGVVDIARRSGAGSLELAGWAIDLNEIDKPLLVFVVVPKKVVLMTGTGKRRDDVAEGLGLPREHLAAGFHEVFDFQFDCSNNDLGPLILAINQKKQFSLITPLMKVGGC